MQERRQTTQMSVSVLGLICFVLLSLAICPAAAEEVCRIKDMERVGKTPGRWIISPACTTLDLSNFMVHEVEVNAALDPQGKLYTSESILATLLNGLELSWGGGARITELDLSGCGIQDRDVPLLLNVLSENTHTAIINAHQASRNPRSAQAKRFTLLSSLTTLRLDNNHLSDEAMHVLGSSLGVDTRTAVVSLPPSKSHLQRPATSSALSGAAIGGRTAPREWLASNLSNLQTLSLQRNRLGVPGVSALLQLLVSAAHGHVAPRLKMLDLRINPVWADKSFAAASISASTQLTAQQKQAHARAVGGTGAKAAAQAPASLENALLWWTTGHSIAKSSLLVPGRSFALYTGPHQQAVTAAARAALANAAGAESSGGPVVMPGFADKHMTLDPQRISISINRALDEAEAQQREQEILHKLQLHSEQMLGLKSNRRVVKLSDMVNGATEGGGAIVTAAEHTEHIASRSGAENEKASPNPLGGALKTHEDDVGNTRVQQLRRQRDDANMVDLLSQCFAGVTSEKNIRAISASLRQLGHPTPRSLLQVDVDDLAVHLEMVDPVYQRLLLRCLCDYNYYYEEAVTARRIASSIHQIDEHAPKQLANDAEARQVEDFLQRSGKGRLNRQTRTRLHADVWGWDESGSATGVSSNSVSFAHVVDEMPDESKSRQGQGQEHEEEQSSAASKPQYSMYRRTHRDSANSRPDLDLTGRAGLRPGSAVRLCESQYFRKAHTERHVGKNQKVAVEEL